jgi:NAD-dependent histone deacetylase SIR2
LDLPYPEAVFDIAYFRNNPKPFYALAKELYPGKFRPTKAHSFVRLLSEKGLLLKLFTQNIDCLEREAGVPDEKIIEAHGSFAKQRCIDCKTSYPDELMSSHVAKGEVPHCITPQCNGLVKPDIVFFGEQLPTEFFQSRTLPADADLCIIMGTSLTVQPFASLPQFCSAGVPRVLINKEAVGGLGTRADDVLLLGDCDTGVSKLASALGWLDELETLWETTRPHGYKEGGKAQEHLTADEKLEREIDILTTDVDKTLKLTQDHTAWLKDHLSKKHELDNDSKANLAPARLNSSLLPADVKADMTERPMPIESHTSKVGEPPVQNQEVQKHVNSDEDDVVPGKNGSTQEA